MTETLALHFHILVPFKKIFNSNQVSSYNIKFPSQITKKSVQPSLLCSKHTFFFLHQTYLIQIWWKRKTKTKFQRYTLQIPQWKSLPASIIRKDEEPIAIQNNDIVIIFFLHMSELKSLQRSQSIWTNFQKARTISEHENIFLRFKLFYSIVYINISELRGTCSLLNNVRF